jgi:hypothetical protein
MPPSVAAPTDLEPVFVSIADAASYSGESEWRIKMLLREGILRARKSGRRTLVEFVSLKERNAALPVAIFTPPRRRATTSTVATRVRRQA